MVLSHIPTGEPTEGAQAADDVALESAERNFVACIDSMQEYVRLQAKLQEQLKQGLINLTRAKYSMGPIGQAQYDGDITASVRVAAAPMWDEGTPAAPSQAASQPHDSTATPEVSGSGHSELARFHTFTLRRVPTAVPGEADTGTADGADADAAGPQGAAGANGSCAAAARVQRDGYSESAGGGAEEADSLGLDLSGDEGDDDEDPGLREANEFLRRMRVEMEGGAAGGGGYGSGQRSAAAVRGDRQGGGNARAGGSAQRRRRSKGGRGGSSGSTHGDPLQWFGVLVPPALKEAQAQFAEVLQTCVQLGNMAQRLQAHAAGCCC